MSEVFTLLCLVVELALLGVLIWFGGNLEGRS